MTDEIRRVDYYYASITDRPGEGLKLLSALEKAGVSLRLFYGFPTGDGRTQVDLVADDAAKLGSTLKDAGFELTGPRKAFLITGADRVGALAEHARKLAGAGVNIKAISAIEAGAGRFGMILWVAQADFEKAASALGA
jgi:hypothetical protein